MLRTLSVVLCLAITVGVQAQVPGSLRLPPTRLPSFADLVRGEPPLVTNITTIPVHGWPEFDRLRLDGFTPLTNAERGPDFRYHLAPGRYEIQLRSFCARGYTYGPTAGDGYVLGSWTGSKATLLREVMQRYTEQGDAVDQRDVQLLVWAILSRANPHEMRGGARRAMIALLGDRGAELLAQGALDHYSDSVARTLFGRANRTLRPLLDYENRMRGMFREANRSYEDFERLTMRPEPRDAKTLIPRERWNLHPGGYLVRITSTGYSRSTMQIVVPASPVITRDALRRVTRFAIDDYALTITYRDQSPGVPYPGDPGLVAHAVTHVRIEVPAARGGALARDVDGWIFTGTPARRQARGGDVAPAGLFRVRMAPSAHEASGAAVRAGAADTAFQFDWGRRAEQASEMRDRIETYEEWYARQERIKRGERPDEDVFDSGHVGDLIDSLFGGEDDRLEQIGETHGRLAEWLAHATRLIDGLGGETPVDPTDSPFAPGRAGGQTLISSGLTP
ncbi:MAG: hypothetical protein Q8L86_19005 [Vicinamibacterales bacterium]|nr:hypothetical protein [Vicinamibacterales bacterium]